MTLISIEYDEDTMLVLGGQCGDVGTGHSPAGNPYAVGDYDLPHGVPEKYSYRVDLTDPDNPVLVEPDPAVVNAVRLPKEQDEKVAILWAAIDGFIQRKPSGRPRYDHNFKAAANALSTAGLAGEPLAKYQAVFAWVDSVWTDVYYPTKTAIDAASTLAELEAIAWDLSPYEVGSGLSTADPDILLIELRF